MKRLFTLFILVLACAVVANVAVAWLFAAKWCSDRPVAFEIEHSHDSPRAWSVHYHRRPGREIFIATPISVPDPGRNVAAFSPWGTAARRPTSDSPVVFGLATGLPLPSLQCEWHRDRSTRPPTMTLVGGIELGPTPCASVRALPLRPRAAMFVANTLFYTGLLALLLFTLTMCRRASRRSSGRCARCGYPAGTSPTCSECGHPGRLPRSR